MLCANREIILLLIIILKSILMVDLLGQTTDYIMYNVFYIGLTSQKFQISIQHQFLPLFNPVVDGASCGFCYLGIFGTTIDLLIRRHFYFLCFGVVVYIL